MLTDYSEEKVSLEAAASYTVSTGTPTKVILANQEEPVFLITQQAYNYLLKSMEEDEAWDLGFLGQSEQHTICKEMPDKLQEQIKKYNKSSNKTLLEKDSLYQKVCDLLGSSPSVYTLEDVLKELNITSITDEEIFAIDLAFAWASQALFQYMEDSPVKTKLLLEAKLRDIHYLVGCVLHEDNSRNYGDRDAFLHKLNNAWEKFIELHPTSLDPCLCSQRNLVTLSVEGSEYGSD